MNDSTRLQSIMSALYRGGLWLLPRSLREKHGEAMSALMERELAQASVHGSAALWRTGIVAMSDLVGRAGYEQLRGGGDAPDGAPDVGGAPLPPIRVGTLARQLAAPFGLSFVVLTGLMLTQYLVRMTAPSVELALLSVPFIAAMTIPMAMFIAALRVSRTLRAASRTPVVAGSLVRAMLIISAVVAACTLALTSEILPRSNARLANGLAGRPVAAGDRSMTIPELQAAAQATRRAARTMTATTTAASTRALRIQEANYQVEIHKKFVLPASCIMLALAGLAIGWRLARVGVVLVSAASVAVFGAVYISLMAAESLADHLVVNPGVAMWAGTTLGFVAVAMSLRASSRAWRASKG